MRIVMVIPGTGGTFYCENCLRDAGMVRALRAQGHDVVMVPLYLPLRMEGPIVADGVPMFFGGINTYLQQRSAFFRRTPAWIDRLLDARWLLTLAARRAGSMRASGLGAMTLSMLRGEDGHQAKEIDKLMQWLRGLGPIDVVHLSNALLLGLADAVRRRLGARVICSLQDEDSWLDALDEPYGTLCWDALRERAAGVSAFTAVSRFYAQSMSERLALDSARVHVVYPGIELESYAPSSLPFDPPVIGYLARMTASLGLERLADAYLVLRRRPNHRGLRLRIAGGMTADDKTFVARTRRKLRAAGVLGSVDFVPRFERPARVEFLRTLTVLSVPQSAPEAFGLYILEALAAGVPVVQPAIGGFEEVIKATGGGVLFEPNTPEKLAETLGGLLEDPERVRRLGEEGRRNVGERFTLAQAARNMLEVYAGDPG